ncbi:MAG: hypothetical protein AAF961_15340 [Planctomycetota bacterium]
MQDREIEPIRVKPYALTAGLLSGVFWLCLLFDSFSVVEGWQLENFKNFLVIPVVATAVIVVGTFFLWRHANDVRKHGELADATVTRLGPTVLNGKEIYLTLRYDGCEYTEKRIVNAENAMTLKEGSIVQVVVDRRRPERFYIESLTTNGE